MEQINGLTFHEITISWVDLLLLCLAKEVVYFPLTVSIVGGRPVILDVRKSLKGRLVYISAGLSGLASHSELPFGRDKVQWCHASSFNIQTLEEKFCGFVFNVATLITNVNTNSTSCLHNFLKLI